MSDERLRAIIAGMRTAERVPGADVFVWTDDAERAVFDNPESAAILAGRGALDSPEADRLAQIAAELPRD